MDTATNAATSLQGFASATLMSERGRYIVFEGGDGVGKSTIVHQLAKRNRQERGRQTYTLEEPDSVRDEKGKSLVPMSEIIGKIVKDGSLARTAFTNVALFNVARRENLLQAIEPALETGIDVFAARNFESTTVYQGFGQGQDIDEIWDEVARATSEKYMHPDHLFILDLTEEERRARLAGRGTDSDKDAFEKLGKSFNDKVNDGYRRLAALRGYPLISAARSVDDIVNDIWQRIN